jgi:glycerophosphoryl diester phosphodiesterase
MRFTPQMRQLDWLVARPIAHRGLHDPTKPENSSAAFEAAMGGNYAIECDIQITADGDAVVFHDDTLDRMTHEKGLVAGRSTAQLKKIRLAETACQIQTLPELLEQVNGKVTLVIEVKSHWNNSFELAMRAVKQLQRYSGPVALMSFDPAIISALATNAPQFVRGIVADRVHDPYYSGLSLQRRLDMRQLQHLTKTAPHFVSFDGNGLPFEPVQQIRAAGFPVICWTVTSEAMASRVTRYADQITFEGYRPE